MKLKLGTSRTLITSPRRTPAVPNADGSLALYSISKYSLGSHSETNEIQVVDLKTGKSTLFSDDSRNKEPTWLVGNCVIWLKELEEGTTEFWIGKAGDVEKEYVLQLRF